MSVIVRYRGLQDYQNVWQQMLDFTLQRTEKTQDEIWITEHPAVYTLGVNGKTEHLLQKTAIPVINTDRGGQVTYHGLGQLVVYPLLDIQRLHLNIRQLVTLLETAMINALAQYGILARAKVDAPGVYVNEKKIGSIGLRVKQGCCYHGLSLNNQMDLSPFDAINTCGFQDLEVTQLQDLGVFITLPELAVNVVQALLTALKS